MAEYDPAWDMPLVNWQQQGSFTDGQVPPAVAPDAGTQVCIGPVAREWLYVILGALDQLRVPSTWIVADDAAMNTVLRQVDKLKEIIAVGEGCQLPTMIRLSSLCVLQYSNDGGVNWLDATDWVTNFGNCVRANTPNPVPPDPGDGLIEQHACNIAGYLSENIIRATMGKISDNLIAGTGQLAFMNSLDFGLASKFPLTTAALVAFENFYNGAVTEVLAQVTAAAGDATLWSECTCAIYNAIKSVGYVTAANFAQCATNLAGVTYAQAWVPLAISTFWTQVGLGTIQNWQSVGAVDVIDCHGCGQACTGYNFLAATQGWTTYAPNPPVWNVGVGWESAYNAGDNTTRVLLTKNLGAVVTANGCKMRVIAPSGNIAGFCRVEMWNGAVQQGQWGADTAVTGGVQTITGGPGPAYTGDTLYCILEQFGNFGSGYVVEEADLLFDGPNPFGTSNCTP